jgi:hypothetical protein
MRRALIAAAAVLALATPALAIEPSSREAIVLRNEVFDGFGYKDTLVPSTLDAYAVHAGVDNAVRPVQTMEYYWPLSRQLYAAFDKLAADVAGTLRITGPAGPVEVGAAPYVIVYPQGTSGPGARMAWGEDARREIEAYRAAMGAYSADMERAQADRLRYMRELKEGALARMKGEAPREVAPPAAEPEPVRLFVSEPRTGYRVNLPAGDYESVIVRDGRAVEGTARRLRSVAPLATSAITWDVVPEERWTRVLPSFGERDTIFAVPGRTFYIVLNRSDRFDGPAYRSLTEPQSEGGDGAPVWVRRGPAETVRLEARVGDGPWTPIPRGEFKVRQTQGAQLGYVIAPLREGESPDITAYPVEVPAGQGGLSLRLVDVRDGTPLEGGERTVVVASPPSSSIMWGGAAAPLVLGLAFLAFRRLRVRRPEFGAAENSVRLGTPTQPRPAE